MTGFVRPDPRTACPCGSADAFAECCGPVIAGLPAATALQLMRSRYTAFVVGDAGHLSRTWHPGTRPERLDLDPLLRWAGLEIVDAEAGGASDRRGVVEFRAHWREGAQTGVLHERSRFVRQSEQWWYLDGRVS